MSRCADQRAPEIPPPIDDDRSVALTRVRTGIVGACQTRARGSSYAYFAASRRTGRGRRILRAGANQPRGTLTCGVTERRRSCYASVLTVVKLRRPRANLRGGRFGLEAQVDDRRLLVAAKRPVSSAVAVKHGYIENRYIPNARGARVRDARQRACDDRSCVASSR